MRNIKAVKLEFKGISGLNNWLQRSEYIPYNVYLEILKLLNGWEDRYLYTPNELKEFERTKDELDETITTDRNTKLSEKDSSKQSKKS